MLLHVIPHFPQLGRKAEHRFLAVNPMKRENAYDRWQKDKIYVYILGHDTAIVKRCHQAVYQKDG